MDKLKELEIKEKEGLVIDRILARRTVFACTRQARDILMAIPARTSGVLAVETNQRHVQTLLEAEILRVLEVLEGVKL